MFERTRFYFSSHHPWKLCFPDNFDATCCQMYINIDIWYVRKFILFSNLKVDQLAKNTYHSKYYNSRSKFTIVAEKEEDHSHVGIAKNFILNFIGFYWKYFFENVFFRKILVKHDSTYDSVTKGYKHINIPESFSWYHLQFPFKLLMHKIEKTKSKRKKIKYTLL